MKTLSRAEREKLSNELNKKTREEAIKILEEHHRCLIVRPTGFGKTYILCKIAETYYKKKYPKKSIIYVYPSDIIVNEISGNPAYENIKDDLIFMSYQKLAQNFSNNGKGSSRSQIEELIKNASVILVDEVHRSAAEGFKIFYSCMEDIIDENKIDIIGVTATIDRTNKEETNWIKQELFKGKEVFDYSLADAIKDGVLLSPIIVRPVFNFDKNVDIFKQQLDRIHKGSKGYNKSEMEQAVDKLRLEWKNSGEDIYNALEKVGYRLDSSNPDDSYMKFIVFFKDTEHMLQEGENIENYFRLATNEVASEHLGKDIKTTLSVEYVISDTTDIEHNFAVKEFCSGHSHRTYRNKPALVGTTNNGKDYIQPRANHIDLVFNINTIIMGYHVPYTSGVMLLRSTSTSILFYQQIGRCFSIKSAKSPIIFDAVSNTASDYTTDDIKHRQVTMKDFIRGVMSDSEREDSSKEDDIFKAAYSGLDEHATEDFLSRIDALRDKDFTYMNRIKYLYVDRCMPVMFIANDLGLTCGEVLKHLISMGVEIRDEKDECKLVMSSFETKDGTPVIKRQSTGYKLLKLINSSAVYKLAKKHKWSIKELTFYKYLKLMGKEQ